MQTFSSKEDLRNHLSSLRHGNKVVLVPTMGALHNGHKSLLVKARELAGSDGIVVASVFVNPIQFDNASDLATYPRQLDNDLALCSSVGVDVVFTPTPEIMYASDRSIKVTEASLSTKLCGASRPGHFDGVCTVVSKLFNLVQPTDAIFGKKDFQQLAIIRRMVRDLDFPITIHGVEIVREESGLALSSRNARLTPTQKANAVILRHSLLHAQEEYKKGQSLNAIKAEALASISAVEETRVDYVEIVNAETMQNLDDNDHSTPALMAVAVFFGDVRLIDNIEL
jgi:pantoate--beta-alanine ligase